MVKAWAMVYKWLINKGMPVDRVSTGGQAPTFYKAPPPRFLGAYPAYNESISQGRLRALKAKRILCANPSIGRLRGARGVINIILFAISSAAGTLSVYGGRGGLSTPEVRRGRAEGLCHA